MSAPKKPRRPTATELDARAAALVARIPYAQFLGVSVIRMGDELTMRLAYSPRNVGNPVLPALHGGAIGAFLEITAILQLQWESGGALLPKPIDVNIDYLRSGRPQDCFARAIITKHGRRVANVRAEAWQDERARPITALHGHFLLAPADDATG